MLRALEACPDSRPRERLAALGAEALSDEEILALILGPWGGPGGAMLVSRLLLSRYGGLHAIEQASLSELVRISGLGPARACALQAAFSVGRRLATAPRPRGRAVRSAAAAHRLLSPWMRHLRHEVFAALYLDNRHRLLAKSRIAEGGLTACAIHPREVLEPALREAAAALIVAHNHPSGDPQPSPEDLALTQRLRVASDALGLRLLDHLVIGDGRFISMQEEGMLGPP